MRQFLEVEADLGSDNEENDGNIKKINKNDAEENEEGLDKDLEGFVVDEKEVEQGDEDAMLDKAHQDRLADDKKETARLYREIILGQNRKRKRGEMD